MLSDRSMIGLIGIVILFFLVLNDCGTTRVVQVLLA